MLIFISVDCPIANAYHPHLQKMAEAYSSKGIDFFLVHSTLGITEQEASSHAEEYALSIPIVIDANQEIARQVKAEMTPEAFVFEPNSAAPSYRGAINNLYAGYGKKRPAANEHYLRDALDELLAGKNVSIPATKPIGCFISFDE